MKRLALIAAIVLLIAFLAVILPKVRQNEPSQASLDTALQQARAFKPKKVCPQVITPAKHTATGLEYNFSTSCLPTGWEASK